MAIKSILVPLEGAAGRDTLVGAALDLGRRFDAHVELLHLETRSVDVLAVLDEGLAGALAGAAAESAEEAVKAQAEEARREAAACCATHGLDLIEAGGGPGAGFGVAWRQVVGRVGEEVAGRGRLFDLILVARPEAADAGRAHGVIEAALFDTRRPVLVVPPAPPEGWGEVAAVAWDGSAEAAAAVGGALPFLAEAKEVVVIAVGEGKAAAGPEGLVRYLAYHEVHAAVRHVAAEGGAVGEKILETAAVLGAGLLVMGAYGHSRLTELVLGGATRGVLQSAAIPVLMAH